MLQQELNELDSLLKYCMAAEISQNLLVFA
jgi:hypothetical protein